MNLRQYGVKDVLRGKEEENIIIRFNNDVVKLPCHCKYDSALSGGNGNNEVLVVKKIEVKNKDGSWSPYPSVTFFGEAQHETRVFVRRTGEKGITIMRSTNTPDEKLISAAETAGIYTEKY